MPPKKSSRTRSKRAPDSPILRDLARSGLSAADAKLMRLEFFDSEQVHDLTKGKYEQSAYKIPYFDIKGRPLEFFRLRFLDPVVDVATGKTLRYWQPPQTSPQLYLSPGVDWQRVLSDKDIEIIITEGEKKAVCGSRYLKVPVLGLGGIWSWKSRPQYSPVIDGLIEIIKGRKVTICFDADPSPNPDVAAARYHLSRAVVREGGGAYMLQLPQPPPGKKNGLDDVLVNEGAAFVREIEPVPLIENRQLTELNEELAIIEDLAAVLHIPTALVFDRPQRLTSIVYSDRKFVTYDSKGNEVEKSIAVEWLKWPQRRRYKSIVYEPGKGRDLEDGTVNIWKGWKVSPKKGDVGPFLKLIDAHFTGHPREHRHWFLQWLAYPLQYPGVKLYTAAVFYSQIQGVGKSVLGWTMKEIYGDNFVKINAADLHGSFNQWAKHKQFVLADEVTGREKKEDAERLKDLIVQETLTINVKYQVPYTIRDCINYLLTTNHFDALNVERYDRRFFIHEIREQRLDDKWFTGTYDAWYRSSAAALFYYLSHYDLSGFDPRGKAPLTEIKEQVQHISDTPVDFIVKEMLSAPGRMLPTAQRDLYMAHELALMLDPQGKLHYVSLAKALRRAGVRLLPPTRISRGDVVGLYPIRNFDKWYSASHKERSAHYDTLASAEAVPELRVGKRLNGNGKAHS